MSDRETRDVGVSTYPEDPFRSGYIRFSRDSAFQVAQGSIELATIVDVIPHARCYKLQTALRPNVRGYLLTGTSHNVITGANDISLLQIDTVVLAYFPRKEQNRALILGAIPSFVWDNNLVVPPVIIPGSDVGITEPPFQHMLKGEDFDGQGKGVENFAAGAPADNLPGDWGTMTEYGVGVLVSKMMAMMRATPNCGVYAFYLDQLLRLHAFNYEHFTSAGEHRIYNDEQELHDVAFRCKFPWEALGIYEYGTNPFKHNSGSGEWKPDDREGYYEPKDDKQTGIWRDLELRGYLGDLHRQMVAVPDTGFESEPITYDDSEEAAYAGLSEIVRGSNGSIGIRSAKEIILSKYVMIPVPHQKTLPDDNVEGDWRKNYKASNVVGEGDTVDDMEDFTWDPEAEADMKPALLLDYMAWVFNFNHWENLLAHKKDWYLNEESEQVDRWELARAYIDADKVTALEGSFWADMPKSVDVDIDSRVKGQKYYESMSGFALLDDGTAVMEDGWGSSIVMHRGNIQISCPGDILMRPGRSLCTFAPKDVVLRAGGSVDVTATTHDIRLKAERNLHVLAGNDSENSDKKGGILLESRSDGMPIEFDQAGEQVASGGIILKCRNSDFVTWANNVYVGTKKMDDREAGNIMLSADEGDKDILLQGSNLMRDIKTKAIDRFGQESANIFTADAAIIDTQQLIVRGNGAFTRGGTLYVEGNMGAGGSLAVGGSGAFGGSIADGADSPHMVAPRDDDPADFIVPVLKEADITAQEGEQGAIEAVETTGETFQGNKPQIGAADTVKDVNFSLRTDDDYKAKDFKIFAARWQQLIQESGSGKVWEERAVTAGTSTTYPYPGRQKYEGGEAFYPKLKSKYFSIADGIAVDRGEDGGSYKDRQNEDQGSAQSLNQYVTLVDVE